jgi:hypothetical protein
MKLVSILGVGCLGLACSASDPEGSGGASGSGGAAAGTSAGSSTSGGGGVGPSGGAAGSISSSGSGGSAGGVVTGGAGGANLAGTPAVGGGGSSSAGAGGAGQCTPEAGGKLSVVGDVVHDPTTCLDWAKTTTANVNFAAAETACGDSQLGGFDDWRIPSASELASIITLCGKYAPDGPVDTTVFDIVGDGYWTTTSAGELNKVCAIGMANAGGYYHYGTAGPQVVRCVRGSGTVKMVKACTESDGCKTW